MAMKQLRHWPRAIVTKKAARSLAAGHPWVFEGEVLALEPAPADGRTAENGGIVDVFEENGTYQGTGLLSEKSRIRIRIISRNANDRFDEAFWSRKLAWAWEYRKQAMGTRALPGCEPDTNCCRVLFSEADGFPGLVVDRYEDVLVSQVGTVGMSKLVPALYPLLLDVLARDGQQISGIYERNDAPTRKLEGLPLEQGWWKQDGAVAKPDGEPEQARTDGGIDDTHAGCKRIICENGIRYDLDIENSQKTGFFLDQKYNRRAVRDIAAGRRVLDCFCHVGPFGLNALAGGAAFAREVDSSETALSLARENFHENGFDSKAGFTCADVLEYLPALASSKDRLRNEGGPFDLIVLDPPAFAKGRSSIEHAAHGYREINYEALRLLPRGGYLATCSCSHFMTTEMLRKVIADAAHGAGVQLRQIEERQQAPDHPILWGVPETHYLDFFIFQVV